MSIGGGSNKQKSSSTNESMNYGSNIWGPQAPWLQNLYQQAGNLYGALNDGGSQAANQLYGDFANKENWNSMVALGSAGDSLGRSTASLDQSNEALRGFLNPSSSDPLSDVYARQMGQQFNEQFLPGLTGNAALAGGLGGSRQQIGAALGSERAMQSIGDFNAKLYDNQQNRALAAAQGLGTNAAGYGDIASGYGNIAAGRLATSQNSMNIGEWAQQMPWAQLQMFQGLLGAPIMQDLGGYSKGTGSGSGSGWNANAGWS